MDVFNKIAKRYHVSDSRQEHRPELLVRSYLHRCGLRFRVHDKRLPGTPDITLPKHKAVVLVHGCFWHGHAGCRRAAVPKTRTKFWSAKIRGNKVRDKRNERELRARGWRVFKIWTCQIDDKQLARLHIQIVNTADKDFCRPRSSRHAVGDEWGGGAMTEPNPPRHART